MHNGKITMLNSQILRNMTTVVSFCISLSIFYLSSQNEYWCHVRKKKKKKTIKTILLVYPDSFWMDISNCLATIVSKLRSLNHFIIYDY